MLRHRLAPEDKAASNPLLGEHTGRCRPRAHTLQTRCLRREWLAQAAAGRTSHHRWTLGGEARSSPRRRAASTDDSCRAASGTPGSAGVAIHRPFSRPFFRTARRPPSVACCRVVQVSGGRAIPISVYEANEPMSLPLWISKAECLAITLSQEAVALLRVICLKRQGGRRLFVGTVI